MTTLAEMTADELREWMTANGWTVRSLADALGLPPKSWRTVQRWRDGTSRVPPYLPLALQALGRRPEPRQEPSREPFPE